MAHKKTPLHFAQQLEDFQTTRKSKEVNEIYTFDRMKEGLKQRLLTLNRRMEKLRRKSLGLGIERPEIAEEHIIREKAQALQDLTEFDRQAYDAQMNAEDSVFDTIAEIQGFRCQGHSGSGQALKQLAEAHADAFAHELNALTERELQKELEQNEKALLESLKKPERLELSSEPPVKEAKPHPASAEAKEREEPELQANVSETEPEAQEKADQEAVPENQEKKKSGSSLIYFRSSPPPPEEGA